MSKIGIAQKAVKGVAKAAEEVVKHKEVFEGGGKVVKEAAVAVAVGAAAAGEVIKKATNAIDIQFKISKMDTKIKDAERKIGKIIHEDEIIVNNIDVKELLSNIKKYEEKIKELKELEKSGKEK